MNLDDELWAELERESGTSGFAYRRLHPDSTQDLRVAIDLATQDRMLVYRRSWAATDKLIQLPQARAVKVETYVNRGAGESVLEIRLRLLEPTFNDVFTTLATDIAGAIAETDGADLGLAALVARLEHWKHLLESLSDSGMTDQRRRGLFGELYVLDRYLLRVLPAAQAVEAWSGPLAANQDFQLPGCAVEVKTSAGKQPQGFVVANERELDDTATDRLYLVHLSLDERRGGTGMSLNRISDEILHTIAGTPAAGRILTDRLHRAGYLIAHRHLYDEPRYSIRAQSVYHVTGSFPRITEAQLAAGVGDVRYKVSLSACTDYQINSDQLYTDISSSEASHP